MPYGLSLRPLIIRSGVFSEGTRPGGFVERGENPLADRLERLIYSAALYGYRECPEVGNEYFITPVFHSRVGLRC